MKVLVVNCGSSSIKYQLLDMRTSTLLAKGLLQRIGEPMGQESHLVLSPIEREDSVENGIPLPDHQTGVRRIADWLTSTGLLSDAGDLAGIAHRVAHGGAEFHQPTPIDREVTEAIRSLIPLAPLHNPANLRGIEITMDVWPDTPQVAVFDTAFHQTIPEHAYRYALPLELANEHHIRRYGFHGSSHKFVSEEAARLMDRPLENLNVIVLHLGNGASAAAVRGGKSIDTSMGMTPLEGLLMGTRCGDLDPGVVLHLAQQDGMSAAAVDSILNRDSGLKGICRHNDMREVVSKAEAGDAQAQLALEMYCYRAKKYIGSYLAALGSLDAVIFTAGIGENNGTIRSKVCENLDHIGIQLDPQKNTSVSGAASPIHTDDSPIQLWVIPTNEELEMARQTVRCLGLEG